MNQREAIEKKVRIGVLDVLESGPAKLSELARRVEAAADIDDIRVAVQRLTAERLVCMRQRRFTLVDADSPADAGPQPVHGSLRKRIEAEIAHADRALTIQEIEERLTGVEHETVKQCLKGKLFTFREGKLGRPGVYSLAHLAVTDAAETPEAPAAPYPDVVAEAEKTRQLLTDLYAAPADAAPSEPIAEPSYLAADQPANDAHRFALWSDGALEIHNGADLIDLPPDATRALIAYLIDAAPQVRAIFDGDAA